MAKLIQPKIVSLFSGCGGLDLGFHQQGYEGTGCGTFRPLKKAQHDVLFRNS